MAVTYISKPATSKGLRAAPPYAIIDPVSYARTLNNGLEVPA